MSSDNSELTLAILNDDVILESPNAFAVPCIKKIKRRRVKSKPRKILDEDAFIKSLNLNEPVHDIKIILNNPQTHWLKLKNNVPEEECLNEKFIRNFSKVHVYRTISEILDLENCMFQFVNARIIGIYKYGKINQNNCHYIQERRTDKKIEVDLSVVNHFPVSNSTYLFFGSIKLNTVLLNGACETVPGFSVLFFQDLPDPEPFEAILQIQKKLNPLEFDRVVSLDQTYNQSTFVETNEDTLFDEFAASLFIDKIESDELLYYETERLMNINVD